MSALSVQKNGQTFSEAALRIATAGSVDDGKSTLIGRLLYDTGSLPSDKIEEIRRRSKRMGYDYLDFSLATDGLEIEREQGITIDVAYIYFSTPAKNYIIADTPGHEEYTRNMVTGASVSEAAVVVVDARKGVLAQTRRHFFINSLLRVRDIIVAVNKMDLVEYSQDVFDGIARDIAAIAQEYAPHGSAAPRIVCIPVSALRGENVARRTSDETLQNNMGWYEGPTVLEHLESLSDSDIYDKTPLRFAVQCAIRPKSEEFRDFRAYAGKVYGCPVREGDAVVVLPAGHRTCVREIYCGDARVSAAPPGASAALVLDGEFNIVRGDLIASSDEPAPRVATRIRANVCWFDAEPLSVSKQYIVQHARRRTNARIAEFHGAVFAHGDANTAPKDEPAAAASTGTSTAASLADGSLRMNEIGAYSFDLQTPLCFDLYRENKHTGFFIIIDPQSFTTAGVGFIADEDEATPRARAHGAAAHGQTAAPATQKTGGAA